MNWQIDIVSTTPRVRPDYGYRNGLLLPTTVMPDHLPAPPPVPSMGQPAVKTVINAKGTSNR
jgi:hypothetical protein